MRRLPARAERRLTALCVTAVACSAAPGAPDAAATPPRVPALHRASAADCDSNRPPGNGQAGFPGAACEKDADCTQGASGRCTFQLPASPACTYDACARDAGCGSASVCYCRDPNSGGANICARGGCVTDADCGDDYCSPSGLGIAPNCRTGITPGQFGYFCHTRTDACRDDADCGASGGFPARACVYDVGQLRWSCAGTTCTK